MKFKVLAGLRTLTRCGSKNEAIEAFKTLAISGHNPTTVVNSHGTVIYGKEMFLKNNPDLWFLYNGGANGVSN